MWFIFEKDSDIDKRYKVAGKYLFWALMGALITTALLFGGAPILFGAYGILLGAAAVAGLALGFTALRELKEGTNRPNQSAIKVALGFALAMPVLWMVGVVQGLGIFAIATASLVVVGMASLSRYFAKSIVKTEVAMLPTNVVNDEDVDSYKRGINSLQATNVSLTEKVQQLEAELAVERNKQSLQDRENRLGAGVRDLEDRSAKLAAGQATLQFNRGLAKRVSEAVPVGGGSPSSGPVSSFALFNSQPAAKFADDDSQFAKVYRDLVAWMNDRIDSYDFNAKDVDGETAITWAFKKMLMNQSSDTLRRLWFYISMHLEQSQLCDDADEVANVLQVMEQVSACQSYFDCYDESSRNGNSLKTWVQQRLHECWSDAFHKDFLVPLVSNGGIDGDERFNRLVRLCQHSDYTQGHVHLALQQALLEACIEDPLPNHADNLYELFCKFAIGGAKADSLLKGEGDMVRLYQVHDSCGFPLLAGLLEAHDWWDQKESEQWEAADRYKVYASLVGFAMEDPLRVKDDSYQTVCVRLHPELKDEVAELPIPEYGANGDPLNCSQVVILVREVAHDCTQTIQTYRVKMQEHNSSNGFSR